MNRALKVVAMLVLLVLCAGIVVPAQAADRRILLKTPAPNLPADIVEVGWSQFVNLAASIFPALYVVIPAPDDPDRERPTRLGELREGRPELVVPFYDRDLHLLESL